MSELTIQWIELIAAVASAGAAIVTFLRGRRWAALFAGLIAAQCLATSIAIHQNALHGGSYLFTLPFNIAVLLLLGRVRGEAERHRAARAEGAGGRRL